MGVYPLMYVRRRKDQYTLDQSARELELTKVMGGCGIKPLITKFTPQKLLSSSPLCFVIVLLKNSYLSFYFYFSCFYISVAASPPFVSMSVWVGFPRLEWVTSCVYDSPVASDWRIIAAKKLRIMSKMLLWHREWLLSSTLSIRSLLRFET